MNIVIIKGRLTKDPEVRYTQSNMAVTQISVAINRIKEGTDFVPVTAFGKTGEFIAKYFKKGQEILVEGELRIDSYEKDNQKHYKTYVVAEKVEFCGSKAEEPIDVTKEINNGDDLPF